MPSEVPSITTTTAGATTSDQHETNTILVSPKCQCWISFLQGQDHWRESCRSNDNDNDKDRLFSIPAPPSFEAIWTDHIQSRLVDTTIENIWELLEEYAKKTPNKTVDEAYQHMNNDVRRVLRSYRLDRLKRGSTQPMRFHQSQELVEVFYRRFQNSRDNDNNDDDNKNNSQRPLRILISGGSAVDGSDASYQHWVEVGNIGIFRDGAWPDMWEKLLNRALPLEKKNEKNNVTATTTQTDNVWVEVSNMGGGGMTSETGAIALRHHLWPNDWGRAGPDIVLGAHAVNDFIQDGRRDEDITKNITKVYIESFLQSANGIRPCYNQTSLPAVWLLDDFVGINNIGRRNVDDVRNNPYTISMYHRLLAQLSGWYQAGAISYANSFRHILLNAQPSVNEHGDNPFTQHRMTVHPGLLVHSTLPVLLTHYLFSNLWQSCMEEPFIAHAHNKTNDNNSSNNNNNNENNNDNDRPEFGEDLEIKAIPELWDRREGFPNDTLRDDHLWTIWRAREDELNRRCTAMASIDEKLFPCTYAWITLRRQGGIQTVRQLRRKMNEILLRGDDGANVDGWEAQGFRVRKPRPGWVATKANATFSTQVVAKELPIKYLTMLSMYSYGSAWDNSMLEVTMELHRKSANSSSSDFVVARNTTSYLVKGYHEDQTSIIVPHTFEVPDGGAEIGDRVRTKFVLVGGTTFRIQGLMYCFTS